MNDWIAIDKILRSLTRYEMSHYTKQKQNNSLTFQYSIESLFHFWLQTSNAVLSSVSFTPPWGWAMRL